MEILDANGKPRFVMENARFKSGEAMRTGEASTASVSLDATKIVTMDQQSLLEFIKQGNHMLLTLKEGTLLLDVALMHAMVQWMGMNDKIAKLIVQVVVIVANYVLSRFFVFRKGESA